jgi:hypothetical protein
MARMLQNLIKPPFIAKKSCLSIGCDVDLTNSVQATVTNKIIITGICFATSKRSDLISRPGYRYLYLNLIKYTIPSKALSFFFDKFI